jgi:hypothetical protein
MDSKIEQVKKILRQVYDAGISNGYLFGEEINKNMGYKAAEINALYSPESQACPKPEQMMICPHCNGSGQFHVDVSIRHAHRMADVIPCAYCSGTGKVPTCIPVPSTPASEGMLEQVKKIFEERFNDYHLDANWYGLSLQLVTLIEAPLREEIGELKAKIDRLEGK